MYFHAAQQASLKGRLEESEKVRQKELDEIRDLSK